MLDRLDSKKPKALVTLLNEAEQIYQANLRFGKAKAYEAKQEFLKKVVNKRSKVTIYKK